LFTTDGGMVSAGLRATFLSTVTKVEAGDKAPKTIETLINYTACWQIVLF